MDWAPERLVATVSHPLFANVVRISADGDPVTIDGFYR